QRTWIDLDKNNRITFIPSTRSFLVLSDKTGWDQLYLYDYSGKLLGTVTSGEYTVTGIVSVDARAKVVYFMARKENSGRSDFYRVGLNGKGLKRLSFGEFTHNVMAS